MDISRSTHRSDEQLEAILDDTGDWVVNDVGGLIKDCVVGSLREALDQSKNHPAAGEALRAVSQLPRGGIIVFGAQIERLAILIADHDIA